MKSAVRLICLFLSCCMLLSILPVAAHMEETDEVCEICDQSPCACTPEEDGSNSLCPDCGEDPCTCQKEDPTPCPDCGEDPCTCQKEDPTLCPDCGQAECVCDKTEETCLGADICVDGIHVPECPLYVAPTCTQDESCTLTENHLEGCPKIQSTPAPISDEDTELKVKMFVLGPGGGLGDEIDRTEVFENEVGNGICFAITIGDTQVPLDTLSLSKPDVVYMDSITDTDWVTVIATLFTATQVGTTDVIYTDPVTNKTEKVVTLKTNAMTEGNYLYLNADENSGERKLWSYPGGGFDEVIERKPGVNFPTSIGILKIDGFYPIDVSKLYSTTELIQLGGSGSSCTVTLVSEEANGLICYDDESSQTYTLKALAPEDNDDIFYDPAPDLLLVTEDDVRHVSYTLYPNESIDVTFRKGSTGGSIPFNGTVTSSDPETLEVTKVDNGYTLTAKKSGNVTLTGTYGENKTITCQIEVPEVKVGAEKLFDADGSDPNGNAMCTYLRMYSAGDVYRQFRFGTSLKDSVVADDLHYSGCVSLEAGKDGYYKVSVTEGNGLIWYTHEGVDYTIPVRCAGVDNGDDFGFGNIIEINGVTYGTAIMEQEKMTFRNNFGHGYFDRDDEPGFSEQIVLAAMAGETVDKNAYSNISDVRFEMLICRQESNKNPSDNATLSPTVSRPKDPASGVLTWGTTVSAEARKGFRATVAMSFTLSQPGNNPRRITLQCHVHYGASEGTVVVYANDLTTVGKLNAVLSSREALINYLKNPGEGAIVEGNADLCETTSAPIDMYLPNVTYDGIVVAQAVPDAHVTNDGVPMGDGWLQLYGSGETIFIGLIHRGGLSWVNNISFVANPNVTMTYRDETFTCGIFSDYTFTDIDVTYDQEYLDKYCGGKAPDLQDSIDLINKQPNRLIANIDLHLVACTFTGFDYGVYATENGMVGGGKICTFTDCHTGIYINANGSNVNSRNVDYSSYTFRNNVYAVRIKSLTSGIFPYSVRVHDCNFYDNYREFWITPGGDYYCYRNYYGGSWQDKGQCANYVLNKNCPPTFDKWDLEYQASQDTGARPGRYYSTSGDAARVITAPCRNTPSSTSAFWIYDREDQNNRILQSEGSSLPIAEESITALTQDTDVYIVENDGSEVAVITFQGTED